MPAPFKIAQGDVMLQSEYAEPVFDFLQSPAIVSNLTQSLSKHGVRLNDMRYETAGSLADICILVYLYNFSTILRVRLDRVELQAANLQGLEISRFASVVQDVIEALHRSRDSLTFKTHIVTVNLHGAFAGESPTKFLSRYVTHSPEGLGPVAGNGVVFYFGVEGPQLASSLTLDLSVQVTDGLYLRVHTTWDGKLSAAELATMVRTYLDSVLKSLELGLE